MPLSRREFLAAAGTGTLLSALSFGAESFGPKRPIFSPGVYQKIDSNERRFHLSVDCQSVLNTELAEERPAWLPESVPYMDAESLPELWKAAGVTDIWLAPYIAGFWHIDWETLDRAVRRTLDLGMTPHFITVPFGHPGNEGTVVETWRCAERFDGIKRWGVSCHAPCDSDCVNSVKTIAGRYGACDLFLDDDYRFADSPADVGGCVCPECKAEFMRRSGFTESNWMALLDDLNSKCETPAVRLWCDFFCDRLTRLFRDTEAASPNVDLGVMVMGMGSEKAGIRLDDYRGKLLRVGEWMFTDEQYNSTKNKTIELFSSLFHARFSTPGRLFSETTIIQELAADNYTSKLSVSTFCDVRNTMFMCPIPASYWSMLAPRMKREAEYHRRLLGQKPTGPFKHFWGIADRYSAGYDAYSLFLATGVPFEVCDDLAADGWTFLGDANALAMERGELVSKGTRCIARIDSAAERFQRVPETFDELFRFRRTLLDGFRASKIPYIEEETPVVLGWYPGANAVLLWNVERMRKTIHLHCGEQSVPLTLESLDSAMLIDADGGFRICT